MHLTIFHYHLLPGGVTQVIASSCISIFKYCKEITGITLVCGRKDNTEKVVKEVESAVFEEIRGTRSISVKIIPEIGYMSDQLIPPKEEEIADKLIDLFRDSIWWIHNFQLGKNTLFTNTLLTISEKFPDIPMVFQIHDFPESGRYNYVRKLKKHINRSCYPVGNNIRYVVINRHDKDLLIASGIPAPLVFLLENPVDTRPVPQNDEHYRTSKSKIDLFFSKTEESYRKGRPIYLYPVRAIRRKNVLEAGLIVALMDEPANLFVTLPGVSKAEKGYSKIIGEAFERNLIPGVFASGIKGEDSNITFETQITASKAIISTSVQEGFGYLFINSMVWQKPLAARHLEIFSEREKLFNNENTLFYKTLKVPVSREQRMLLEKSYLDKISNLADILTQDSMEKLNAEVETLLSQGTIDFSFLSVSMQMEFLKNIQGSTLGEEIKKLNRDVFAKVKFPMEHHAPIYYDKSRLNPFTLESHGKSLCNITSSFTSTYNLAHNKNIQTNILSYFANIGSLRLLYD